MKTKNIISCNEEVLSILESLVFQPRKASQHLSSPYSNEKRLEILRRFFEKEAPKELKARQKKNKRDPADKRPVATSKRARICQPEGRKKGETGMQQEEKTLKAQLAAYMLMTRQQAFAQAQQAYVKDQLQQLIASKQAAARLALRYFSLSGMAVAAAAILSDWPTQLQGIRRIGVPCLYLIIYTEVIRKNYLSDKERIKDGWKWICLCTYQRRERRAMLDKARQDYEAVFRAQYNDDYFRIV